jgi:hypothetical protein
MKLLTKLLIIFTLSILTSGCNTLADSIAAKGSGEYRIYDESYDVVWDATTDIIQSSSIDLISADKKRGKILAQGGITPISWGENVAIFIETIKDQTKTRIEIISKRSLATNITARNWSSYIFDKLDKRLKK